MFVGEWHRNKDFCLNFIELSEIFLITKNFAPFLLITFYDLKLEFPV